MPFSRWSDMTQGLVVGGRGLGGCGSGAAPTAAECDKMQSGILWPSVQNWPRERACERHDGMSFALQASLGDSCDVYRPASMTVGEGMGAGGSALFRQELGLSSDSKILLIYVVSTPVFSPTSLTSADRSSAGKRWHSLKLFVCLLLTFNAADRYQARRPAALPRFDLRCSDPVSVLWNTLKLSHLKCTWFACFSA